MSSFAHIEDGKNELVTDVHTLARLVVHLVDFENGNIIVQNCSKSSFDLDMKSKKYLDSTMVELNKVVSKKSLRIYPKREMMCFITKVGYVF